MRRNSLRQRYENVQIINNDLRAENARLRTLLSNIGMIIERDPLSHPHRLILSKDTARRMDPLR